MPRVEVPETLKTLNTPLLASRDVAVVVAKVLVASTVRISRRWADERTFKKVIEVVARVLVPVTERLPPIVALPDVSRAVMVVVAKVVVPVTVRALKEPLPKER